MDPAAHSFSLSLRGGFRGFLSTAGVSLGGIMCGGDHVFGRVCPCGCVCVCVCVILHTIGPINLIFFVHIYESAGTFFFVWAGRGGR